MDRLKNYSTCEAKTLQHIYEVRIRHKHYDRVNYDFSKLCTAAGRFERDAAQWTRFDYKL